MIFKKPIKHGFIYTTSTFPQNVRMVNNYKLIFLKMT